MAELVTAPETSHDGRVEHRDDCGRDEEDQEKVRKEEPQADFGVGDGAFPAALVQRLQPDGKEAVNVEDGGGENDGGDVSVGGADGDL